MNDEKLRGCGQGGPISTVGPEGGLTPPPSPQELLLSQCALFLHLANK